MWKVLSKATVRTAPLRGLITPIKPRTPNPKPLITDESSSYSDLGNKLAMKS